MGKLLTISGAGTGVDSGIKTFRTDTVSGKAMWDEHDIERVCNYQSFVNDPSCYQETHEFYNKRRQELVTVSPNTFHKAVSGLYSKYGKDKVLNITTNVDDLLERAGIPHEDILHVHGYLPEVVYKLEESKRILDVGYSPVNLDLFDWVKPNVVFFGEAAPLYGKMYDTIDLLGKGDVVVVVGCSNLVINFNWDLFPILSRGIKMIVVNPDIKHHEEAIYSERGVITYRKGSSEVWGDPDFITLIESYLN